MSTDAVRHQWDILADGLDPIIETLSGFDDAIYENVMALVWCHSPIHPLTSLFADVWNKTYFLDVGRVQRGETVRVWLQQHGLDAVSDELERRRLKLIAALRKWEKNARSTVLWNVNTIETFHEIPNSGGIQWPKSQKPELIHYLGDDFSDSLRDICSDVAELATYLKMQRAKVANQLAKVQQPIAPPAAPSSGGKAVKRTSSKRRKPLVEPNLTAKQLEAMQIVGECKGDIAEAARRLGKDRSTIKQHYDAATAKLGKRPPKHSTEQHATDRRGQANLATDSDKRL